MPEKEILGARLVLPDGWEDCSIYRFAAPAEEGASFRPNFVLARHRGVPDEIPLEDIFRGPNTSSMAETQDFQVLRQGKARYLEQDVGWQDVCFFDPHVGRMFFQRQLAIRSEPMTLVVVTLTSDRQDLDELSAPLGFSPPREEAKGGGPSMVALRAASAKKE